MAIVKTSMLNQASSCITLVQPRGAMGPALVGRRWAGVPSVAFLDAPIGICDQLRGPDAGDAERRERQADGRRRQRQREPRLDVAETDVEPGPLQDDDADHREQSHRRDEDRRDLLKPTITAREQQGDGRDRRQRGPEVLLARFQERAPGGDDRPRSARQRLRTRRGTPCARPGRRSLPSPRSGPAWPAS